MISPWPMAGDLNQKLYRVQPLESIKMRGRNIEALDGTSCLWKSNDMNDIQ
jgi:hypothetical protein